MANNLFNSMQGNTMNPIQQIINEARAFKENFKGNPRQEVEKLIASGQMSQEQFNHLSQIAQQIVGAMGVH